MSSLTVEGETGGAEPTHRTDTLPLLNTRGMGGAQAPLPVLTETVSPLRKGTSPTVG